MSATHRLSVTITVLLVLSREHRVHVTAQQKKESPVFKAYRPPLPPVSNQPTAAEDVAQAFVTARKANAGDALAQFEFGNRYHGRPRRRN